MTWYSFSQHALTRAVDMAITAEELVATLETPARIYIGEDSYKGATLYERGKIALPVADDDGTVITVLWSRNARAPRSWDRDDLGLSRDD